MANRYVSFHVGPQTRTVLTNAAGEATANLALLGQAGSTELTVTFAGDAEYEASFDTVPFTITKQPTSLTLVPEAATVELGQDLPFVATLMDGLQRPFGQKTVFFIITGENGSYAEAVITDFAGRATLHSVPLPVGVYTVDVYFSGTIPLPSGNLNLPDDRYLPSSVSGLLTIVEPVVETGQTLYLSTAHSGTVDG
ncbi:MAG: hypothetical protein KC449_30025, partial [Anaerolineales bacterium]|nr:hypothetical protein [Anaerolineales bacterium]